MSQSIAFARRWLSATAAVAALGILLGAQCQNPAALTTGLTGTINRGPITPVCREGVPCDAPMQAHFEVRRGDHVVATFDTDAQGHFTVRLPPGSYQIVASGNAGLIGTQSRDVTVGQEGLTQVQL